MKIVKSLVKTAMIFSGKISPVFNTELLFLYKNHRLIDLKNPKSFAEKISYLKLFNYNSNPLVQMCSDKLRVREYVIKKGLDGNLNDIYGIYTTADDINWDDLPNTFVLKWNYWYGLNIICTDKSKLDIEQTAKKMNNFAFQEDYYVTGELQYDVSDKVIICEKYIPDLINFKLYYFSGICKAVLVNSDTNQRERLGSMYDPYTWENLKIIKNYRYAGTLPIERPDCFQKMLDIGNILAEGFPFVRIDMYIDNGRPVVGEMTFTPGAGITPTEATVEGHTMGQLLRI